MSHNAFGSAPGELDWEDVYKTIRAFAWNAVSLTVAVTSFLISFPKEQVPTWLWGFLISAPFLNALGVAILQWRQDNRP